MTQQLQEYIYASEDFREKSEKLARSIEINSVLLSDSSSEKAGQRNAVLGKLCRQAAQAKEAGNAMEMAMQNLEREMEQGGRENGNAERSSQPENRKSSREKDTGEKAVKSTAEKAKNIGKEVKQPMRGR